MLALLAACLPPADLPAQPPGPQPAQRSSRVAFDPGLSDPFFASEISLLPWWIVENPDGTFENTLGGPEAPADIPRLKQTARCWTRFQYPHEIRFCEAELTESGELRIFLHDETASTFDNLEITVKDGRFRCQYWTTYPSPPGNTGLVWVTKKQRLTLDRKICRPGDLLKGRVDFTCEQVDTARPASRPVRRTIRIQGVFMAEIRQKLERLEKRLKRRFD
ncbi:MAG: hypothetical protein KA419_11130 [Acidobacteria bacterium]|nr:hypothetical protein [Acidobacteriota bacterium]